MNANPKKPPGRQSFMIAVIALLLAAGALGYLFLTPRLFCATAKVRVWRSMPFQTGKQTGNYDPELVLPAEAEFLRSQLVLDAVAARLKPGLISNGADGADTASVRKRLRQMLRVSPRPKASVLAISVWGKDSGQAAAIANEIARVYVEERGLKSETMAKETVNSLDTPLQDYDARISTALSNAMTIADRVISNPDGTNGLKYCPPEQYLEIRSNYDSLLASNRAWAGTIAGLQNLNLQNLRDALPLLDLGTNSTLSRELDALDQARRRLQETLAAQGPDSIDAKEAARLVQTRESGIEQALHLLVSLRETETTGQETQLASLKATLQSITTNRSEALASYPEYHRALQAVDELRRQREQLVQKLNTPNAQPYNLPAQLGLKIVELADATSKPAWPNQKAGWGVAAGGLAVAATFLGLHFLQERARRKRRGQATLTR